MRRLLLSVALVLSLAATAGAQIIGTAQRITTQDSGTACSVTLTCASFPVGNAQSVVVDIGGTWTGTLTVEATTNGTTWRSALMASTVTGTQATTTTAAGSFAVTNAGFTDVRVRATAAMTGTAVVSATRGSAPFVGTSSATLTGGGDASAANQVLQTTALDAIAVSAALLDNAISGAGFNITQFGGVNVGAGSLPVTESGTWTVQPGNTANTTAWLIAGGLTNNNAAIGAVNIGALTALANAAAPSWTEGRIVALSTDLSGALRVTGSAGGTSLTDDGAFTVATTPFTPSGGTYRSVRDAVDDNDGGAFAMTAKRGVYATLETPLAVTVMDETAAAVKVLLVTSAGAAATLYGDATHDAAAITTGPQLMAEFDDTTPDAVDEGDAGRLRISANRNLYVTLRDAAGNERGLNIDASGFLTSNINGTVTVGSHAVTNAGTFAAQVDGAALTALQLIDDAQTGDSVNYHISVGTTEDETEIKATAGRIFSVAITNVNAAVRYFRCYNLTAANTTPGTSTVFFGLAVPGATTGAGFTHSFGPNGLAFGTALTCTLTTGQADTDVAEVAANELRWTIGYK